MAPVPCPQRLSPASSRGRSSSCLQRRRNKYANRNVNLSFSFSFLFSFSRKIMNLLHMHTVLYVGVPTINSVNCQLPSLMPSSISLDPSKRKRRRCKCCKCSAVLNMPTDPTVKKCVRVVREAAPTLRLAVSVLLVPMLTRAPSSRTNASHPGAKTGFSAASAARCCK